MKRVEAPCPACGAPVEFKVSSSLVTVCEFCSSVVARGDTQLEDYGKVARLVPLASPLSLGVEGTYRQKSFEVLGHAQYQHAGGGVWNEWYAAFPGDRWGWLAEAQGRIYLTFQRTFKDPSLLPGFDALEVGESLQIQGLPELTVAEKGEATLGGAEGEMPFLARPGTSHRYVDLQGEDQVFATLDYDESGQATFYLGQQVTLEQIGIQPAYGDDQEAVEIAALIVNCPQCGGSLELFAPDKSERVVCPFCHALLDAKQGNLKYLQTIKNRKVAPIIPLGTKGTLNDVEYCVIGFLQRSVTFDRQYYWTEYLLYNATIGFRWLIHSDDHWSFAEPVSAGDIKKSTWNRQRIYFRNEPFSLFQDATATIRYVLGEFYWMVAVGERAETADYVRPPFMISEETSILGGKDRDQKFSAEVQYTLARYLPHEEVERAFNVKSLRRGWGVAPNQPFPVKLVPLILSWMVFALLLAIIDVAVVAGLPAVTVDQSWFVFCLLLISLVPGAALFYRHSFEVKRWEESEYNPYETEE